ncbi:MAG: GntR family transcriptional regulator [Pseudomonadota bacterium]
MADSPASARFAFAPGVPEQVADYLQAQIVRGELAPGERIAEARVTAALNVSRGPVREALQRLAARHLVFLEPRRGARVSSFDLNDAQGLFDVYVALVIRLAERVAQRVGAGDDHSLDALLTEHSAQLNAAVATGDTLAVLGACDAFLARGAQVIGNAYLGGMLARLAPAFGRAHYVALNRSADATTRLGDFVSELIDAITRGRSDDVAAIVERYARAQMSVIAQELGEKT